MKLEWESQDIWQKLRKENREVLIYGMGNGGDKLFAVCARYGISIAGVCASPGFVRKQSFRGFTVQPLEEARAAFPSSPILLAFGSDRPELLERFAALDASCDFYAPDLPLFGEELFNLEFASAHRDELERAFALLRDDRSRAVFQAVFSYKLSGKIGYLTQVQSPREELCELLHLSSKEHFVDVGAYCGDTIAWLLQAAGGYATINALEPDHRNFAKLSAYCKEHGLQNAALHELCGWSGGATLSFSDVSGRSSAVCQKGREVPADSVDHLLGGSPATLIKIDAEGAEREVLEGCGYTIGAFAPKLMVSAYHRSEDLFAIPLQLAALYGDCAIYLRHHPYVPAWETNYYVEKRQ